ncbi:MAG TPA: sensor histidine kinase [Solirubrobacteraceae bacterium]|nr:sensor histidine kinase [Solirubrobacteraceae bacterium]
MARLRRLGLDLVIAIGAVVAALEVAFEREELEPGTSLWLAVLAVVVLVASLLLRRRMPFGAPLALWLLAAAITFFDGRLIGMSAAVFAAGMAAAFLLGAVTDARQSRVGLVVTVVAAAIVVHNGPDPAPGDYLFTPALFAIAWLTGFALRERAAHAEAAEARAAQAEREREENARRAVFAERVRIARELHDVVAHHVSVMGIQAGAARVVVDRDPVKAKEALSAIEASSRQAVVELHRLLGFLRQAGDRDERAPTPRLSELPRLAASMRDSNLSVDVRIEGEARSLPPTIDVSAYRIVQEALTNTLKHSAASRADVRLRYGPDELEVEVVDDGRADGAVATTGPGGLGLIGMRERAALHGGRLSAGPLADGGYHVKVTLPTGSGAP